MIFTRNKLLIILYDIGQQDFQFFCMIIWIITILLKSILIINLVDKTSFTNINKKEKQLLYCNQTN